MNIIMPIASKKQEIHNLQETLTLFSRASPVKGVYDTWYCSTCALGGTQLTSMLTAVSSEMDTLVGPPPNTEAIQTPRKNKTIV